MQFIAFLKTQLSPEISSILRDSFKKAERLSSTNDQEAYLLRIILNEAYPGTITEQIKRKVNEAAEKHPSGRYYLLQYKPEFDDWNELALCCSVFGVIALVGGIWMISNNDYITQLNLTYLVQVVKGGGYVIILGLVMAIGGLARYRQEIKRKKLLHRHELRNGG